MDNFRKKQYGDDTMKIWAHRGASAYAPENTLEAFQLAWDMGADGIELDVHLCASGEVVVGHDDKVDRMSNGSGYIKDKTLAELKALDVSGSFAQYAGAKMPLLSEVYALLKDSGMTVNVELKTRPFEYPGIEQKCVALAEEYGMTDRVIYSSFNHDSLLRIKQINPALPTGLLYSKQLEDTIPYAKGQRADAIHPLFTLMYEGDLMAQVRAAGILVHPWTVDDPQEIEKLMRMGANALITNKPDVALAVRDGKKK